jgi:quercetin dioxygenase-like cupin family protein
MGRINVRTTYLLLPGLSCALAVGPACLAQNASADPTASYSYATNGVLDNIERGKSLWKLVVNESNLGGNEVEVAELTLAAGTDGPQHMHGSVEIIYVLAGTYDHEVNGKRYRLTRGMVGIVRPGDSVRHIVPTDEPAKLLILWTPAGDGARLATANGTTPEPVPELAH